MDNQISVLERELYQENVSEPDNRRFLDRMTDWYFRPKSFERSGKFYEALGTKKFKRLVAGIGKKIVGDRKLDTPNNYFIWDTTSDGLKKFDYKTRMNEAIHLFWGACSGVVAANDFLKEKPILGGITCGLAVLNAYCVMTQRYNRARLHNVIDRIEEKEKMPAPYK
jgi:hypothetical protein